MNNRLGNLISDSHLILIKQSCKKVKKAYIGDSHGTSKTRDQKPQ